MQDTISYTVDSFLLTGRGSIDANFIAHLWWLVTYLLTQVCHDTTNCILWQVKTIIYLSVGKNAACTSYSGGLHMVNENITLQNDKSEKNMRHLWRNWLLSNCKIHFNNPQNGYYRMYDFKLAVSQWRQCYVLVGECVCVCACAGRSLEHATRSEKCRLMSPST